MKPIKFKQSNFTFKRTVDMTDEQCSPLPVCRITGTDNTPLVISCWELTDEDIVNIQKNRKMWLIITGTGMPPVALQTETPFEEL